MSHTSCLSLRSSCLAAVMAITSSGSPRKRHLRYHIDGSFPGPKEYFETDSFIGSMALGKDTAYVYNQHAENNYWDDTQVALVQGKDGFWTKYMNCAITSKQLVCQGYVERNFMPRELYVGETWTSNLQLSDSPWITLKHRVGGSCRDGWEVQTVATYKGPGNVQLLYLETFNRDGVLTYQAVEDPKSHKELSSSRLVVQDNYATIYFGGKSRIARAIGAYINRYQGLQYYEPFCGGLWVSQYVQSATASILSDACLPLITLYRAYQKGWRPPERSFGRTLQHHQASPRPL